MKTKMKKFPKTPFKLDCGDLPEVRQWLHDSGCVWGDGESLITEELDAKFLLVYSTLDVCFSRDIIIPETDNFALFNPFKNKSKLEARVEALERVANKQASLILKQSLTINKIVDKQLSGLNEAIAVNPIQSGRYKPKPDEEYYFIDRNGRMALTGNNGYVIDIHNISTGNCYRAKQEAEQALARQQALVRVNDRIDELNDDECMLNHVIGGMLIDGVINITTWVQTFKATIFNPLSSEKNAKLLISEMEDDIKLAAGWEK